MPRQKTCKHCKGKFTPERPMQSTCSFSCAVEHSKKQVKKEARKKVKEYRASDRVELTKKAQTAVNQYIRLRDGKKCISCGYEGDGRQFHAGHFRSQGGNSALRYHELNIHAQCSICNNHKSGNLAEYRKALIDKIGLDKVEWLESYNTPKKWTVDELKEIIADAKAKIKELKEK